MNEVKLNVGGIHFSTTLQTLRKYEGSMLNRMFDDTWLRNNSSYGKVVHPFFIDRDGYLFQYILRFLRDGVNMVLPDDEETLASLLNEAKYFLLDELVKKIVEIKFVAFGSPGLKRGDTVRFRPEIAELYAKSVLACILFHDRRAIYVRLVCGIVDVSEACAQCLCCSTLQLLNKERICQSDSQNEAVVRNYLCSTTFTVECMLNKNCCELSPRNIHVPISSLEILS